MSDYVRFRLELVQRILDERLTPRAVAEELAEYARSHRDSGAPGLDEIQTLYRRGDRWGPDPGPIPWWELVGQNPPKHLPEVPSAQA